MTILLPEGWRPWRRESPLDGHRPDKAALAKATSPETRLDDVLPYPTDQQNSHVLRLLIVGTNTSPWAAAVRGPFARPGNRFWSSLHVGGVTTSLVNASRGLSRADERMLAERGVGITNIVARPSSRADELSLEELRAGAAAMTTRVKLLRPGAVVFTGITAFRRAFKEPKAKLGQQEIENIAGWPSQVQLWVVPDPSGLNAHESVTSLAEKWHEVWEASDR